MEKTFALKGNIIYSRTMKQFAVCENGWLVCEDGICRGVFPELPEKYRGIPVTDYGDRLIIPGLTDLHVHAPQYTFRSVGLDSELIEWLNAHAFPEESRFADPEYAEKAYRIFLDDLLKSTTTRVVTFGTLHAESTFRLMELLEETGIRAYVGKVNMDRNCPPTLCEESAERSAADTEAWIRRCLDRHFENVRPILTPRFIPSCSDKLMELLSILRKRYDLPVQSHLSENPLEIEWVKQLCPGTRFYGDAYDRFGLFGGDGPAIMAHCVHCPDGEIDLMKERGVFVAHCPQSNTALASGIAPVRRYLDRGLKIGLGSDVAGGFTLSMFRMIVDAIQCSKLLWRLDADSPAPLSFEETFFLATVGGGSFFGKAGSFEPGYEFDAVVLDDTSLAHPQPFTVKERLERLVYLSDDRNVAAKYIAGRKVL